MQFSRLPYYYRVFMRFRQMQFMRLSAQRGSFIFWSIISLMWTLFNYFFFWIVFRVSGSFVGWSWPELLLLNTVFSVVDAFTWSVFYANMRRYSERVYDGSLNTLLTKPIDTQFLLMTAHNGFENVSRLMVAGLAMIWVIPRLDHIPSPAAWLLFTIMIGLSLAFLYFLWFLFTTLSFYFERLNNVNDVIPAFRRIWQVPSQIYTGIIGFVVTALIPMALITAVPTEALLGRLQWQSVSILAAAAVVCAVLSRKFFLYSVRHYKGVGQ